MLRLIRGRRGPVRTIEPGMSGSWLEPVEAARGPILFLLVCFGLRLVWAASIGLAADEAYYWTWGQRLAFGYYDHPPGIAWVIRASTAVLGDTELGVRFGVLLLGTLTGCVIALGSRRPWLSVFAFVSMPLVCLGGQLATPDVPLLFGWSLGLLGALVGGWGWLLAGLGCAIAALSKLTGWFLLPILLVGRLESLRTRWPWLAVAVFGLCVAPHVLWLLENDGISLRFQLDHGFGGGVVGLAGGLEFFFGQWGLVGPVLFVPVVLFFVAGWKEGGPTRLLWVASVPVFLLFLCAAVVSKAEANWAAPAYVSAAMGLGYLGPKWRRASWIGAGFSAALSALVLIHAVYPLWRLPSDPTLRLIGGQTLAESVEAWGIESVYTERYQEASWIWFYAGIPATTLPGAGRDSQFDVWNTYPDRDHALYVRPWRSGPTRKLDGWWDKRAGPNTVVARDALERRASRWQVYELHEPLTPEGSGK